MSEVRDLFLKDWRRALEPDADAAERAHWGKPKVPPGPRKYGCSRMRDLERRRGS